MPLFLPPIDTILPVSNLGMVLGRPFFYEENQSSNLAQANCWGGHPWSRAVPEGLVKLVRNTLLKKIFQKWRNMCVLYI